MQHLTSVTYFMKVLLAKYKQHNAYAKLVSYCAYFMPFVKHRRISKEKDSLPYMHVLLVFRGKKFFLFLHMVWLISQMRASFITIASHLSNKNKHKSHNCKNRKQM